MYLFGGTRTSPLHNLENETVSLVRPETKVGLSDDKIKFDYWLGQSRLA